VISGSEKLVYSTDRKCVKNAQLIFLRSFSGWHFFLCPNENPYKGEIVNNKFSNLGFVNLAIQFNI
jgi:hypothetical protein